MRQFDAPPVWFLIFAIAGWAIGRADPWHLSLGPVIGGLMAAAGIGGGILLIALAVVEMRKWRTTLNPHGTPGYLVTSGIFKRSRNPIYLGLVLLLAGVIFRLDAPLALPLVPIFLWWIERHFVIPEENLLRRHFRIAWARYEQATRRWI